jgi:hypothetical protein
MLASTSAHKREIVLSVQTDADLGQNRLVLLAEKVNWIAVTALSLLSADHLAPPPAKMYAEQQS